MTSIALDIQKNQMIQRKNELEFQEIIYTNQKQTITGTLTKLAEAHADDDGYNIETDPAVNRLKELETVTDVAMASIESQLKELNAAIDSFGKAVDTNIKTDYKLNIFST